MFSIQKGPLWLIQGAFPRQYFNESDLGRELLPCMSVCGGGDDALKDTKNMRGLGQPRENFSGLFFWGKPIYNV